MNSWTHYCHIHTTGYSTFDIEITTKSILLSPELIFLRYKLIRFNVSGLSVYLFWKWLFFFQNTEYCSFNLVILSTVLVIRYLVVSISGNDQHHLVWHRPKQSIELDMFITCKLFQLLIRYLYLWKFHSGYPRVSNRLILKVISNMIFSNHIQKNKNKQQIA